MHLQIIVLIVSMVMYTLTLMVGHLIQKKEMHLREVKPEDRKKRAFWLTPADFLSFTLNTLSVVGVLYGAKEKADSWSVLIAAILVGYTIHIFSPAYLREGGGKKEEVENEDEEPHQIHLTPSLIRRP